MSKNYLIEKIGSLIFVATAILLFNPSQLLNLLIVMGQGHFFLAYLYQYKAGKMNRPWVVRYIIISAILWIVFAYILPIQWLMIITGTQFLLHFMLDEVYLYKAQNSIFTSLEAVTLATVYFGVLHTQFFANSNMGTYTIPIALSLLLLYVILAIWQKYKPIVPSYPVLLGLIILVSIQLMHISIPAEILLGSVILFHYSEWYINFYFKLQQSKDALRTYVWRVVVVNILVITAYLLYVYQFERTGILQIFFAVFFFYLWTLLHTITSIRKNDIKNMLRLP